MGLMVSQLVKMGETQLKEAGIENAGGEAEIIFCSIKNYDRAKFFLRWSTEASDNEAEVYLNMISERARRKPMQQIIGSTEFMGYPFIVRENVLIPRMDTETVVEKALELIEKKDLVLDMCTGSGIIGISIAKECEAAGIPVKVTMTDISADALKLADDNAKLNNAKCEIVRSNLFDGIRRKKYNVIVSNPPYIPSDVIGELEPEVRDFDPLLALDGGEDGLDFYRRIVEGAPAHLKKGGRLVFEIGHDQGEAVTSLMEDTGFEEVCTGKDLAGNDRVVTGVFTGKSKRKKKQM